MRLEACWRQDLRRRGRWAFAVILELFGGTLRDRGEIILFAALDPGAYRRKESYIAWLNSSFVFQEHILSASGQCEMVSVKVA